jgi:hypothetical protein
MRWLPGYSENGCEFRIYFLASLDEILHYCDTVVDCLHVILMGG